MTLVALQCFSSGVWSDGYPQVGITTTWHYGWPLAAVSKSETTFISMPPKKQPIAFHGLAAGINVVVCGVVGTLAWIRLLMCFQRGRWRFSLSDMFGAILAVALCIVLYQSRTELFYLLDEFPFGGFIYHWGVWSLPMIGTLAIYGFLFLSLTTVFSISIGLIQRRFSAQPRGNN